MKKLWKKRRTLRENVQRHLTAATGDYFAAGRVALAAGSSWAEMHQFRLATKRFRYTLEVFRKAYGPGIELRIDALKRMQTLLGEINDCIVTSGMVEQYPGSEELRLALAATADGKTRKLRSYWLREFDAPGEEQRWIRYLRIYACRRQPLPRTRRLPAADTAPV